MKLLESQIRGYAQSLRTAILDVAAGHRIQPGIAAVLHEELLSANPSVPCAKNSIMVPFEALMTERALTAGNFPGGGALVGVSLSEQIEHVLRPASVCLSAGARVLANLRSNLTIGREAAPTTFQWLHELEERTDDDSDFTAVSMTPHRLSGGTTLTRQLQGQTHDLLPGFLVESLSRGIGAALDKAGLQGTGHLGEPLGIMHTNGVKTVTFGAAPTWAKAISFERQIADENANDSRITYIAHPDVREKWRNTQRFTNAGPTLWSDDGTIAGHEAKATTNMPASAILAGNFEQMAFGLWGGNGSPIVITVDPYTRDAANEIRLSATIFADCALIQPQVFCRSTDSAIQ